jgi:hypothetical protein
MLSMIYIYHWSVAFEVSMEIGYITFFLLPLLYRCGRNVHSSISMLRLSCRKPSNLVLFFSISAITIWYHSGCDLQLINCFQSPPIFNHFNFLVKTLKCVRLMWPLILNQTPIFQWYMAKLVMMKGHYDDTCVTMRSIGPRGQDIDIILSSIVWHNWEATNCVGFMWSFKRQSESSLQLHITSACVLWFWNLKWTLMISILLSQGLTSRSQKKSVGQEVFTKSNIFNC